MRPTDFRSKIDLEAPRLTPDDQFGFSESWSTVASGIWAAIWPVKSSEQNSADKSTGLITHTVRIRFRLGVRPNYRIKFGNIYLGITSEPINVDMESKYLEMRCAEVKT